MTITAPVTVLKAPEMSVVSRKFMVSKEVKTMTTATALDRSMDSPAASRTTVHGIDRAVERLAVALLRWSRSHAARRVLDHSEHSLRLQQRNSELQREADALRITQRIGF